MDYKRSWFSLLDTALTITATLNNIGSYQVVLRGYNSYGADSTTIFVTVNDLPTSSYTVTNAFLEIMELSMFQLLQVQHLSLIIGVMELLVHL